MFLYKNRIRCFLFEHEAHVGEPKFTEKVVVRGEVVDTTVWIDV